MPSARSRRPRAGVAPLVAVLVAVVSLAAAAVVVTWGTDWVPTGDDALIALDVRDVWSGPFPLLGAYSRFGWRHPGPALFWTLAPFDLVGGRRGLPVGAAAVAIASIGASIGLLWRRGGALLGFVGGAVVVALAGCMRGDVFDPWNPTISLLPFVLLVLATWSVTDEDWWTLPVVVGLASWLVQVHVGYALMAAGLVTVAIVAAARGARRGGARRGAPLRRPVIVSFVLIVVLWLPAALETLAHWPGNLERLVKGFVDSPVAAVGISDALGVAARGYATPWAWVHGLAPENALFGTVDTAPVWLLVVPILASAGAAFLARRRGQDHPPARSALRFQMVVWLVAALAAIATSQIHGEPFPYLFRWLWMIGALIWLSAGWSVAAALLPSSTVDVDLGDRAGDRMSEPGVRVSRAVVAGAWTVFTVTCLVTAGLLATRSFPFPIQSDTVRALAGPVAHAAGKGPVLLDSRDDPFVAYSDGLAAALAARGVEVWRPDSLEWRVGRSHTVRGRAPARVAAVAVGPAIDTRRANGESPVAEVRASGPEVERVAVFVTR